jgi:hypothetical protein
VDVVIVLDGAIQAKAIASALAHRYQLDLTRDDLGLEPREQRVGIGHAQAQSSMLGCASTSSVSSGSASDSTAPWEMAILTLICMAKLQGRARRHFPVSKLDRRLAIAMGTRKFASAHLII